MLPFATRLEFLQVAVGEGQHAVVVRVILSRERLPGPAPGGVLTGQGRHLSSSDLRRRLCLPQHPHGGYQHPGLPSLRRPLPVPPTPAIRVEGAL